jgi:hypothetical protein
VIEMADESQREVTSPQIVSRATLRVQWSSRLDLTLVCSAARDFGTRAFALPERFYRGCCGYVQRDSSGGQGHGAAQVAQRWVTLPGAVFSLTPCP